MLAGTSAKVQQVKVLNIKADRWPDFLTPDSHGRRRGLWLLQVVF